MDADSGHLRARSSHPVGAKVVRLLALLFNALVQTLKPAVDAGRPAQVLIDLRGADDSAGDGGLRSEGSAA